MKKYLLIILFVFINTNLFSQCLNANSLYVTNITYINAIGNWTAAPNADHYLIHYRILGTTNWNNIGNIDSTMSSRNIPQLQQLTTYEWQIKTFCDTSNQPNSGWSVSDTFTTIAFIPSPFNPVITNAIYNDSCNTKTSLTLNASQIQNEPDIGTSTITSDGGYFDIQSISIGDSVGYAIMNTNTQTIITTLRVGIVAGQNYAIINSYDSLGLLIGFFSIENINGGIKVSTTSPNDGNNYTSGFTSEIYFTNLFVTPNIAGNLNFYADIQSELGDQFNDTNTITIACVTPTWDCDGQGNCNDPGTGQGAYTSILACQSSCAVVTPTWDCNEQSNCSDPGTGQGAYSTYTACLDSCVITDINEESKITSKLLEEESEYEIYDLLGRNTIFRKNKILIYKYLNGTTKKIIITK